MGPLRTLVGGWKTISTAGQAVGVFIGTRQQGKHASCIVIHKSSHRRRPLPGRRAQSPGQGDRSSS
jgi:hypothetical protein